MDETEIKLMMCEWLERENKILKKILDEQNKLIVELRYKIRQLQRVIEIDLKEEMAKTDGKNREKEEEEK